VLGSVLVPDFHAWGESPGATGDTTDESHRMYPQTLLALLKDPSGRVLLARRKGAVLWGLPGGELREAVDSRPAYLAACCARQVGVTPDFVAPLVEFAFAGAQIALGIDEVAPERVRAGGRMAAVEWFGMTALPVDLLPVACMAVAMHAQEAARRGPVRSPVSRFDEPVRVNGPV